MHPLHRTVKYRKTFDFLETLNKIKVSAARTSEATAIPGQPRQMLENPTYKVCILNSFDSNKGVKYSGKRTYSSLNLSKILCENLNNSFLAPE